MKTLVTGASGLLGGVLMKRLGPDAVGVSRRGAGAAGPHRTLDLADSAGVRRFFEQEAPDLVIHAAAFSDVDGCERDPQQAWTSNALAVKHLAAACAPRRVPLVHVSTDYVFGTRGKRTPYTEDDAVSPVNIYGLTKLAGENFARNAPGAIVRTSWLYGPGNPSNFVNAITARLKSEPLVKVLDDQEDSPTSAEDLAEALVRIGARLTGPSAGEHLGVFQVCNAGSATRLGMTLKMKEMLGVSARVEPYDRRELKGRVAIRHDYLVMSTARYENFFKTRLRRWEDALKEYLCAS
ncbi:MAG TPA: SDR family oxidoreductase [Candidatus Eisenbacteria bacterium]|nr:SDR family oxidoreductase [Candidatus Eisenbacteria bacterium]